LVDAAIGAGLVFTASPATGSLSRDGPAGSSTAGGPDSSIHPPPANLTRDG
jgi:hypothetical protein